MEKSTFCYKYNPARGQHPLEKCSYGIYYKNAKRLQEGYKREYECVIMDYGNDCDHAISQIELSCKMGNEYALKVLHIDKTEPEVKVIYPLFEDTMSGWLEKLEKNLPGCDLPENTNEYDEWMKGVVFPKIRKLWQLLLEMRDKKIHINMGANDEQGYSMPLIRGVPKPLDLQETNNGGPWPPRLDLSSIPEDNLELDYPRMVLDRVVAKLTSDGSYKLPANIEAAQDFWDSNQNKYGRKELYGLLSTHPVLWNTEEKSRFLQLFCKVQFPHSVEMLEKIRWYNVESQIMEAEEENRVVYERCGLAFTVFDQVNSDPQSRYYQPSKFIKFTRELLKGFNKHCKRGRHLAPDDIVETADRDLAICSACYTLSKKIIADQGLITQDNWNEAKNKLEDFFKWLRCRRIVMKQKTNLKTSSNG